MDNPVVIIDTGTHSCKAGFASDQEPRTVFPSVVARHRFFTTIVYLKDAYVGHEVEPRSFLQQTHPIERGVVTNWDDMEKIWHHAFYSELSVEPSETTVIVTEPPLNPSKTREKTLEIMFESFSVPALYLATTSLLTLYVSGRKSGVVVDVGDGAAHIVPFLDGLATPETIRRVDLAGQDLTDGLLAKLKEKGYTTVTQEVARDLKERHCYIASDPAKETVGEKAYTLPDGQVITLADELFWVPEAIFNPSVIGSNALSIQQTIVDSILKCDEDVRQTHLQNIVLSGGTTLLPGFRNRLQKEIAGLAPPGIEKVVIDESTEYVDPRHMAFVGGCILASSSAFKQGCVLYEEYDDMGPTLAHSRFPQSFDTK